MHQSIVASGPPPSILFDESFDPFSPIVKKVIRNGNREYMDEIETLWKKYYSYASPSFRKEFLTNESKYYSLLWEMLLTVQFLENGFTVEPNPDDYRPDICLFINRQRVWVECCAPTRGDPSSPDYEAELPYDGTMVAVNQNASVLRCVNALSEKRKQHKKWLEKGICGPDDPYIIALSGIHLDLRISNSMMPGILRALYAMGDPYVTFDVSGDERNESQGYEIRSEVTKKKGGVVPTNFFMENESREIIGVIYSTDWLCHASTGPDYCYVQNVNSSHKGDWGFDRFMQTYNYHPGRIRMKNKSSA